MKYHNGWVAATLGVIFYLALLANGQNQDRISKKSSLTSDQINSKPVRGSMRYNSPTIETPVIINDDKQLPKDESTKKEVSTQSRRKSNYRTVSRTETVSEKDDIKPIPKQDVNKSSKGTRTRPTKRQQESQKTVATKPIEHRELLIDEVDAGHTRDVGSPMPRPTRQSESRRGNKHSEDKNTVTEQSEVPRRRTIPRSKQLKETEITKLEVVVGENRRSRSRVIPSENRRVNPDEDVTSKSKTVISSRRAPRTQTVEAEKQVLTSVDKTPRRGSVRGPKLGSLRANPTKKDLDFEIDEDDNYPQEFLEKIKKSSAESLSRPSSSKEDVVDVEVEEATIGRSLPSRTTPDKVTLIEETSPKLPSRSGIFHNRRRTNTGRLSNNVTPLPASTAASIPRTASPLRTRANFRARASALTQSASSSTSQPSTESPSIAPPSRTELRSRFTKVKHVQEEDNSIHPPEENNIDSVQKTTERISSNRPSFKPRQKYVPKSRLVTTTERDEAITPIKSINSNLRRSNFARMTADTPRPLRPLISSRLRTYSSQVTQQYINEVSATTPTPSVRTQVDSSEKSASPTKAQSIEQIDERINFVRPALKSRIIGVRDSTPEVTERVRFKPSTTDATSSRNTDSGFRRSLKRTTNTEAVEKRIAAQQAATPAGKQRFSSRYRGDTVKSGRASTPGYIPTLPSFSPTQATPPSDIQATGPRPRKRTRAEMMNSPWAYTL